MGRKGILGEAAPMLAGLGASILRGTPHPMRAERAPYVVSIRARVGREGAPFAGRGGDALDSLGVRSRGAFHSLARSKDDI